MKRKYNIHTIILLILVLILLISGCISSDQVSISNQNSLSINTSSENGKDTGDQLGVPVGFIREYGYYFLNSNGFDLEPLVCELDNDNLERKYLSFASELGKTMSKLLLNIKLTNSAIFKVYSDIFNSLLGLEHIRSNYYYFLEIEKMYMQVKDLKIKEYLFDEEEIESEIQIYLTNINGLISSLSRKNEQMKEGEFCTNLYLFRFKGLKQIMMTISGFVSSILSKKIVANFKLDYPQFNLVFDLISKDMSYLTYISTISELNLRLKATFQRCLHTVGSMDIPLFGGDSPDSSLTNILSESFKQSFGIEDFKRSAGRFGPALDELAENNIYRVNCESVIYELKEFINSQKIVIDDSLHASKTILQSVVSIPVKSEALILKYKIFKDYFKDMVPKELLFNNMAEQIIKESLRTLILFISEHQFQLHDSYHKLNQIFDYSKFDNSLQWWDNYFSLYVDNTLTKNRLSDLSNILDISISSFNNMSIMENRVLSILSLELLSRLLRNSGIDNMDYVFRLINDVHVHSKFNMIKNSYLIHYETLANKGLLDADISNFMQDLSHGNGIYGSYDESCGKLKTYFKEVGLKNNVQEILSQFDSYIYSEVQKHRISLERFHENKNSANVLFITKLGNIDQYQSVIDLIENLILGETSFEEHILNYLDMRSCIGDIHFNFSQLTSLSTSTAGDTTDLREFLYQIRDRLFSYRDNMLKSIDISVNNEVAQFIESTFEIYLLAQIYFPGSLSQTLRSMENPDTPFGRDDLNFIYDSIVREENLLFRTRDIKPYIFSNGEFKERVSFLYSVFGSYLQQASNLNNYLIKWNKEHILDNNLLLNPSSTKFINLLNSSLNEISDKLIHLFSLGSLSKKIEKDILRDIEMIFLQLKSQECTQLLDKLSELSRSEGLIERLLNGLSMALSQKFIDEIKNIAVLNDFVRFNAGDKMATWTSLIYSSNYPGSILVNKELVRFTEQNLDSGCNVAYLDRIGHNKSRVITSNDHSFSSYNVVVIHCKISNEPGGTIIDFLKRRALIKDSGSVTLPGYLDKMLDSEIYISYLAVDFSLANSLDALNKLEVQMNQQFLLFPDLHIDYFPNLDTLIVSGGKIIIDLNRDFIRKMIGSLATNNSELDSTNVFLYKSTIRTLELPLDKDGRSVKVQVVGKYSGFGGETPVCFAIINDGFQEFRQDASLLVNAQKRLFQGAISNYVPVYKNFAPLNTLYGSVREFVWIASEKSHVLYMMLLRGEVENKHKASEEHSLIYPVATEIQGQTQISHMNAFFNSIARRRSWNNLFYDVVKNKIFILNDSEFTADYSEAFSEFVSETSLFVNLSYSSTHILDVSIYESDISNAMDSYVSGSMPLFCSSRRNYLDNSILLNMNKHLTLHEIISYRSLLHTINPLIKLKVRNLPSQSALRRIFHFGKDYFMDLERFRFSYILPLKDINDRAAVSAVRKNIRSVLANMIQHTSCPQLSKFTTDISSGSIGYNIVAPTPSGTSIVKSEDEIFQFNGKPYFVVRYSQPNLISALSDFLREVLDGKVNVILASDGFDLTTLKADELPSENSIAQVHRLKGVPIELVENERLIRIYVNSYETENLELVHQIMSIYHGFDLSIVTKHHEYHYFYLLCWDLNEGSPKICSYVQIFRYLRSNIFEKLKLYQISLNRNVSLSAIAEEGEILSLDFVGLSILSRFGGSVLYKSDRFYELYYYTEQYWDMCSFAREFFKFSPELPIKAINFDPSIKDIIFMSNFSECPVPEITALLNEEKLPHFVTYYMDLSASGYIFTLYDSIRYQTLSIFINFFTSKKKIFIRYEGLDHISSPKSIFEILSYFVIEVVQNTSVFSIRLNEISLRYSEIQSAKIVANQIKSLIPNSTITGINTRGEKIF
ncbi:putative signal peptide protein [Cryptosporidium canis]|uniref:Signal peptide protein n=1 Tax=Cryptosporidium canis TaxID=195482 RepID=A0ABQ8PBZ5_9CRYT|nr:putative signal peptide protein [Cryptosporidium canis]KAJ1615271.1 putative signal peptide protein [Cryptosporidium canis]